MITGYHTFQNFQNRSNIKIIHICVVILKTIGQISNIQKFLIPKLLKYVVRQENHCNVFCAKEGVREREKEGNKEGERVK